MRTSDPPPPTRLVSADPVSLRRPSDGVEDPVLKVVLARAEEGSRPHARSDPHTVCLAVEGGGMRGAVTAGMGVVLEAAGLVSAFDRIYGVSAGALNGCATATGQAALNATRYEDAARRHVVNPARPLVRQPLVDFDLLFDDVIAARKPLAFERIAAGPEFISLATSLESLTLRVLSDFADSEELLQAVRVSASLPRLCGDAPSFRGEQMIDGALIEPIPFETALAQGASHVLVLRSRAAGYRKPSYSGLSDSLVLRGNPALAELIKAGDAIYNRQASQIERWMAEHPKGPHISEIAVGQGTYPLSRLLADVRGVDDALRLGAGAMGSAVLSEPIDLCWQPVVVLSAPAAPLFRRPALTLIPRFGRAQATR